MKHFNHAHSNPFGSIAWRWLVVIALVVAAPMLLLAPRTAAQTPTANGVTVLEAHDDKVDATPSGDQTLRLTGPVSEITTFDPALARDVDSAFLARLMFRGLTRITPDLKVTPELADRIEISEDGLTYVFHLRENATFQNGDPVTARDVVASLTRALQPATAGGDASLLGGPTYLSDIKGAADLTAGKTNTLAGARVIDDKTVELTLSEPRATFLMKLAAAPASVVQASQVNRNPNWWRAPNGSGPFKLDEWRPDEMLVLTANPTYVAGAPILQRVEFLLGPNAGNAFNLYQSGQIDTTQVPLSATGRVVDPNGGVPGQLAIEPMLSTDFLAFRTDVAPMDDPLVRKAIAMSFPREKFAEVAFNGYRMAADGLLPPGLMGRDWPVPAISYDPAAAKALIAQSSYADKPMPPIQIYGVGPFGAEVLRDTIKESLGIDVEVISLEWPDFASKLAKQELPGFDLVWVADYPDPETFLATLFGTGSADNYSGYHNPQFDALLQQAQRTLDDNERAALYDKAHQMLIEDAAVIPMVFDVRYQITADDVKNLEVTPLGILDLDRVWMEH